MDRESVLSAAVVLLLAVILFMCWLHACGKRKQQRRAQQLALADISIDAQEETSPFRRKGLDKAALEALPTFVYGSVDLDSIHPSQQQEGSTKRPGLSGGRQMVECPVCLSEFQEAERGRLLPNCRHRFHVDCIDTWLLANGTCPVCRASCAAADVAVQVAQGQGQGQVSVGVVGVQYPTNVLFWGSNVSVLAVSSAAPIQISTAPYLNGTEASASASGSASSSTFTSLRRLLSRERINTPTFSKV